MMLRLSLKEMRFQLKESADIKTGFFSSFAPALLRKETAINSTITIYILILMFQSYGQVIDKLIFSKNYLTNHEPFQQI